MSERGQLHKSNNAALGGVCSGIADYLDLDPVVVRILFVAAVILSLGVALVPYVVLCIVLPSPESEVGPLDVEAQDVQSEVFGCRDARAVCCGRRRSRSSDAFHLAGLAHMPPVPPVSVDAQNAAVDAQDAYTQTNQAQHTDAQESASGSRVENNWLHDHSNVVVVIALLVGSVLLSSAVSFVVASLIRGASWWQCWPLLFVILGFVRVAVPGRADRRLAMFASGACLCVLGITLLTASVGVVSWNTFLLMFERLWPLLVGYIGFTIAGIRFKNRAFIIAAACLFIFFCVFGLRLCALPGPMHEFTFVTPLGREYHVVVPFPQVM